MVEERNFNICTKILARLLSKIRRAEPVSVISRPTAVIPRADNEDVKDSGVLFLDMLICFERAIEIFVVVPTANGHCRTADILEFG